MINSLAAYFVFFEIGYLLSIINFVIKKQEVNLVNINYLVNLENYFNFY